MQRIVQGLVMAVTLSTAILLLTAAAGAQQPGDLQLLPPVDEVEATPPPSVPPAESLPPEALAPETLAPQTSDAPVEEEVLAEEVVEYMWFDPHYWFRPPIWDGSFELGMNGSEGNAKSFSIKAGANLKRTTEYHVLGFDVNYFRTSTDEVQTQHNALLRTEYERLFGDESPWSLFVRNIFEYDEFRAFDLRHAVNAGVGYRLIRTERVKLKNRFGAGASREYGGPNDEWSPEAVFGVDYEHQLTEKQKLSLTMDYFPEWGDFTDFRLLTVVSWEVVLDAEANLHLKLALNDQYDSTPEGAEPNDLNYSLLLLWKL
jgi:putative salt-induced outer membrane protein YdiY